MIEKIVIDVRTREEYVKNHIEGALNIALHNLEFNIDFLRDKKVYVYCNSGIRANIAKKWLRTKHIDAYVLKGDWEKDYKREKRGIICAVNYLEIQPEKEKELQDNLKILCQKTNEVDGFLGSKLLCISVVSSVGSFCQMI